MLALSGPACVHASDVADGGELAGELRGIRESLDAIDLSNSLNFMIGITIAFIAIIATIYNSKKLNRQLAIHEREIKYRTRPVLVRGRYDDGNTFSIRDADSRLWIKVTNVGPLPAVGIKRRMRSGITRKDSDADALEEMQYVSTDMPSIGPDEYVDNIIRMSEEEYGELCGGERYFFELEIEYAEPENREKRYRYHIRGHFEKRNLTQDHVDMS